jgi:hypothetical protein
VIVTANRFRLIAGADGLANYQWVPPGRSEPNLDYRFCNTFGSTRASNFETNTRAGARTRVMGYYRARFAAGRRTDHSDSSSPGAGK